MMRRKWVVAVVVAAVFQASCSAGNGGAKESVEARGGADESNSAQGNAGTLRSIFGPRLEGVADPVMYDADVGSNGSVYILLSEDAPSDPESTEEKNLISLLVLPPDGGSPRLIAKQGQPGFEQFYGTDIRVSDTSGEIYVYDGVMEQVTIFDAEGRARFHGYTGEGAGEPRRGILDVGSGEALALDSQTGDLYLATGLHLVRLDGQGDLHVLLEDTISRVSRESGEGGPIPEFQEVEIVGEGPVAAFEGFTALALNERTGDLFFCDGDSIFRLGRDHKAQVIAGKGTPIKLSEPNDVYLASDADAGSLYFLTSGRVFRIDSAGMATVVAGNGEFNSDETPDGPALRVAVAASELIVGPEEKLYLTNSYPPQVQVLER